MKFRVTMTAVGLLASVLGPTVLAAAQTHDAAWYKKHSNHSAAWYKKHSSHDAAWFREHSNHDAAWYREHGLPDTGAEPLTPAIVGMALAGLGLVVRRRSAARS
jgi:LPXTG-motif cell wall-anchored protein